MRDGRHDLGTNGIWIQHGWLADDAWFERNGKAESRAGFRDPKRIRELAEVLRNHHVSDVFPHLCPATPDGRVPAIDDEHAERFLDAFEGFRVMPWVGGAAGQSAFPDNEKWRASFARSIRELLAKHPRFAGVHVNIESCPSGSRDFLLLLDEIRKAMPPDKVLSVAAYPPPTFLHPHNEVHWDEVYFGEVAARSDQLVVMMYDTALHSGKLYRWLMSSWTREVLAWSGEKKVLFGLPAYEDGGSGYHHPQVENLENALAGVHAGLGRYQELPAGYQGTAIYCEWEMNPGKWGVYSERFLKR